MSIIVISDNKPGNPANTTEVAEVAPGNPANTTEVAEVAPGNPANTTEVADNSVGDPTSLVEVTEVTPGNPANTTEVADNSVGDPTNLVEATEVTPGNPANTTEVAEVTPGNPANTTEVAEVAPGNPANTTEVAEVAPSNPTNTTEVARARVNRTGGDVVNLNFAQQLYNVDFDYARASSASYFDRFINEQGQYDYVLRNDYVGSVTNLLTYSEDFSNEDWAKTRVVVKKVNLNAPFKNQVFKLTVSNDTTDSFHSINQLKGVEEDSQLLSFNVKYDGYEWIILQIGGNGTVYFNILNGSIGNVTSTIVPSIKFIGDGWYEISVYTPSRVNTNNQIIFAAGNGVFSFRGDGKKGYLISKSQLTESVKTLPYVKTLDSAVTKAFTAKPRIEYEPETGECLGYLAEGASTNLALRSEEFTSASWTVSGSTINTNVATSPDKTKSASRVVLTGVQANIQQSIAASIGEKRTQSFYVKSESISVIRLVGIGSAYSPTSSAEFNLNTLVATTISGAFDSLSIKKVYGGWVRVSATNTMTATGVYMIRLFAQASIGDSFLIWGAQLEALPFATSYIRTEGAAVSRAADVLTAKGDIPDINELVSINYRASVYGQAGTSIKSVIAHNGIVNRNIYAATSGTETHRAFHGASSVPFGDSVPNVQYKISYVYDRSTLSLYVDSVLKSGASAQVESGKANGTVSVGHLAGANSLYGHIKEVAIYNYALTANEVKSL